MPRCCRCGASDSMQHSCPFDSPLQRTHVVPIRQLSPRRIPLQNFPFSPDHSPTGTNEDSFLPSETSCLQDLLRHTCNYAHKMEARIGVHRDKGVGECTPPICPELEKDLLFTEMTTKTTGYYRGMVNDRMSTRRFTLDKTEQDMCQGFNRVISILRKMEKCDEFCDVINELQNVRAQVKVLTVAAERYGATSSEIRFLNDLEKVIRYIECIDKQHEQTACELKKLRLMNDELCNLATDAHVTDSAVQCYIQDICQSSREQKSTSPLPPCVSSVACQAVCRAPSPPCQPCLPPTPPAPCVHSSLEMQSTPYLGDVCSIPCDEMASYAKSVCSKEQVCGSESQASIPCSPQFRASTPICSRPPTREREHDKGLFESPCLRQRDHRPTRSVDEYQTVCADTILSYPRPVCPEPSMTSCADEVPPCPSNKKKPMDLLERLFYIGLFLLGAAIFLLLAFHLFSLWQRMNTSLEDQSLLCDPCSPTCLDNLDCYCHRMTPPPPPEEEPCPDPDESSPAESCGYYCQANSFFQNFFTIY